MSNSLGTYGFLPWMQQGLAGKINQTDISNAGPTTPGQSVERAEMQVEVTFNGSPINKTVKLVGPGDILAISSDVYVRTEPLDNVYDYEANCLPFVEFYEEDFPWRYTPAKATVNKRLRPWLALVVLEDSEFSFTPPTEDGLPGKITITVPLTDVLHPYDEHWAWAHVHVHQPADSTVEATLISSLKTDLPANLDIAVSRLMSSRRLKPQTQYTAFIIPAFETGRLAGLGVTGTPLTTMGSLVSSWHPSNAATPNQFPVYKQWRFGTAALGDFETLARALQPRIMDPSLGSRPMDVNHSGMGLDGTAPVATVGMEGALAPAAFAPVAPKTLANTDAYTLKLKALLNLPADVQQVSFPAGTVNPFVPSTTIMNDPVVVPPTYGQWHANVPKLQTGVVGQPDAPVWLQELNLDPRYRAAAGLGAKTVRERQEQFMESAWKQIGEVMAVNDKIAKARLALEASKYIYQKHLIGKMDTVSVAGQQDALNGLVKTAGLSFKKISVNNPAYNASDPLNNNVMGSAMKAAAVSNLTKAGPDSGFRKVTRSRSTVVQKINGTTADINFRLAANLNAPVTSGVAAATSPVPPASAIKISTYTMPGTTGAAYGAGSLPSSSTALSVAASMWSNINYSQLAAFKSTLRYLDQKDAVLNPVVPNIAMGTFISQVRTALDPEVTITERVKKTIGLQFNGSPLSLLTLKPVMAYPVMDEPMYDDLIKISTEYLLPNLGQYPNNTVTLLSTNNKFIEAYMAGLNHEFAKELLWREYPTDQRGSYFRRFWDINDTPDNTAIPDYLYDINPMHQWPTSAHLGQNHTGRHAGSSSNLVLLVRGDLLKKYPNAMVFVQKAVDYTGTAPHPRQLADALDGSGNPVASTTAGAVDSSGNPIASLVKFPIFKANLNPDVVLLGFDLTKEEALGQTPAHTPSLTNGGWYVVFKERPGQLRFGLDEPTGGSMTMASWDDITWAHLDSAANAANVKTVHMSGIHSSLSSFSTTNTITTGDNLPVHWNDNAAMMAWILFQNPAMVAIHAEDMIG